MGLRYLGNIIKPGYNPLASNITTGVNVVQYQGVFTAQQQLQAQANQQWSTDPLFDYSTLLLQADGIANGSQNNTFLDSSTNAFAITRNGNTTQGTFSPFSSGGWSGYFDGTSDYIQYTNSDFSVSTGDFTAEWWMFITSDKSQVGIMTASTNPNLTIGYGSGSANARQPYVEWGGSGAYIGTMSGYMNTWVHICVMRSSGTVYTFQNGVLLGSASKSAAVGSTANMVIGTNAGDSAAQSVPGYLSNVRFAKAAIYSTSGFTPATTAFTRTSQNATNVQFLTLQSNRFLDSDGINTPAASPLTITRNGDVSVQAFSPFAPQFQYTASGTGGSGYFDGTGDYLTLPSSTAAFQMGSGDFTVDCWIYPTASTSPGRIINNWSSATTGAASWELLQAGGGVQFLCSTNGSTSQVSLTGGSISLNSWNHIAGVRSGNVFTLYVNGVSAGTTTQAITLQTADTCTIGARNNLGSYTENFVGYISNARITKGTAIYTGTFTVPTGPFTATMGANPFGGSNTASATAGFLGNFTNAGILDGTMKNNLETVGGASVSTSVVKYGSGSMYFDGSGDYLTAPNSPFYRFGTGDFTIEMWVYPTAIGTFNNLFMTGDNTTGQANLRLNAGKVEFFANDSAAYTLTGVTVLKTSQWYHIAFSRANGYNRIFINGVLDAASANSYSYSGSGLIQIGAWSANNPSYQYAGYMDDVRITNGIARYTQNFIPPSVALPRQ